MIQKSEIKVITRETEFHWQGEAVACAQFTSLLKFDKSEEGAETEALKVAKERVWQHLRGDLCPLVMEALATALRHSSYGGDKEIREAFTPLIQALEG